jgi:hypothetical protein
MTGSLAFMVQVKFKKNKLIPIPTLSLTLTHSGRKELKLIRKKNLKQVLSENANESGISSRSRIEPGN